MIAFLSLIVSGFSLKFAKKTCEVNLSRKTTDGRVSSDLINCLISVPESNKLIKYELRAIAVE